ncbi:MAG: response regulator [Epsilonproteobacteria bacterium]|nr:response regulator [Campylobacterota bacterium]
MKILIVDDNKNNRMILRLMLEDYAQERGLSAFEMDEAEDGSICVRMCQEKSYDIVFMDIMMPNMDGIEATRIIREQDKRIMIIAVSAVDDASRQKLILNNGAEDYISKPVNSDIFLSRMGNYITLVETRQHKRVNLSKINLFSDEIFSRHVKFMVLSEDTLSEFWEYYLLDPMEKYDGLSDVVRSLFSLADAQVRLGIQSEIYVEDSEEKIYFTLTKVDGLPKKVVELILRKNGLTSPYKIEGELISFELEKIISKETPLKEPIIETIETPAVVAAPSVPSAHKEISYKTSTKDLTVCNYIDPEDLQDLEEYAGKLNSLMLVVGSGDITEDEVVEIYTYLERIGSIISSYSEVYPMAIALNGLAADMATHMSEFSQNSEALGPMCRAFSNDMSKWIEMSFHTGAPSPDFMNDTIVVNCQTISSMITMNDAHDDGGGDLDDIFDF